MMGPIRDTRGVEQGVDLGWALDPASSELQRQVVSAVGQADGCSTCLLITEESDSPPSPCPEVLPEVLS